MSWSAAWRWTSQRPATRTFEELNEYCYLVASSVGLMCRKIFGYRNESTRDYAINLGIALQLTNILRDIKDDAKTGTDLSPPGRFDAVRVYGGGSSPASGTPREFVDLMRFECDRARRTSTGRARADRTKTRRFFFAARIMWSIYAHTLRRIERSEYNVFDRRISIPGSSSS